MKILTKIKWKLRKPREIRNVSTDAWFQQQQQQKPSNLYSIGLNEHLSTRNIHHVKFKPRFQNFQKKEINVQNRDKISKCDGSFHQAIGKVLLMAECFALMPVRGVTAASVNELSFNWLSWRFFYSISFIIATFFGLGLATLKVINQSITFDAIEPIIFRISILMVCISMLSLARKWPSLMAYWHEVEKQLPPYTTRKEKSRLCYEIRLVTYVAMFLSLGEHLMSLISSYFYAERCAISENSAENFFLITNDEIFQFFPFSYWLAFCGKMENIFCTFAWNYMDVFVMNIGIGLTAKFRQINQHLNKFKGMQMPEVFWQEQRKNYRNVCILTKLMDSEISLITLVSFSNNFYFICVQLLKSLNEMPSIALAAYFYYSLIFLFGRTLTVTLYSAGVYDESRKPLRVLRWVPKESWNTEVRRFAHEINYDMIALSGLKFFHLTRKLVLGMCGTIATYVLVLIQFHKKEEVWGCEQKYSRVLKQQKNLAQKYPLLL